MNRRHDSTALAVMFLLLVMTVIGYLNSRQFDAISERLEKLEATKGER